MTPAGASRAERARAIDRADDPPADDAAPALTVAAVARRLGVAPATLRTWDRRYGLGPSEHVAGSHRRYTSSDTARLLVMRRLTLEGIAPAEAARIARSTDVPDAAGAAVRSLVPPVPAPVVDQPVSAEALTVAAQRHDTAECTRQLIAALHGRTVTTWWSELVEPVLRSLTPGGKKSTDSPAREAGVHRAGVQRAGDGPDAVLAVAVLHALREELAGAGRRTEPERAGVLVRPGASALWWATGHALAAALEIEGAPAGVLTPGWGAAQLLATVEAHRPGAVVVLGLPEESDRDLVQALHRAVPDLHIFVSTGPGDVVDGLPWGASVHRVRTFTGALHEVLAVSS